MGELQHKIEDSIEEVGIAPRHRQTLIQYLNELRQHDVATCRHSIRVTLKAQEVARHFGLPAKTLTWFGVNHDRGKLYQDKELLQKEEKFSEEDLEKMQKHVLDGHDSLVEEHPASAYAAGTHHLYQRKSYSINLDNLPGFIKGEVKEAFDFYIQLVALCDGYDAATHRSNDKFGKKLSREGVKTYLLESQPSLKANIESLYAAGIFR